MRNALSGILSVLAVTACAAAAAAPEPAIVPAPGEWTVEVAFEGPQQISIRQGGEHSRPQRFWYVIVTLTNNTGRDVEFYPKCELMTDTFELLDAVNGASPVLIGRMKARHQQKYPFLEPLETVGNKILEGEDNAKEVAVIFADFDPRAKGVKIFITGLSNETAVVEHPVEKDANGEPVKVYLRKTLELSYKLGGDASFRAEQKLEFGGRRWVMR